MHKDHRPGRKRRSSEKSYSTTVLGASSSNDSEDGFEALASRRLLKSVRLSMIWLLKARFVHVFFFGKWPVG